MGLYFLLESCLEKAGTDFKSNLCVEKKGGLQGKNSDFS
jgi:hypothetical protein